jgi:hypothetical protein
VVTATVFGCVLPFVFDQTLVAGAVMEEERIDRGATREVAIDEA